MAAQKTTYSKTSAKLKLILKPLSANISAPNDIESNPSYPNDEKKPFSTMIGYAKKASAILGFLPSFIPLLTVFAISLIKWSAKPFFMFLVSTFLHP